MPWVLGAGAPAGEWVRLPGSYGPGAEARWVKGKGEKGLEFRVGTRRIAGTVDGEYRRFRWAREDGTGQYSVQSGRLWVWLREGRRLGDHRWQAHHATRKKGEPLHLKLGGRVAGMAAGSHATHHAADGGRARAAQRAARKSLVERRLAAMRDGKARPLRGWGVSRVLGCSEEVGLAGSTVAPGAVWLCHVACSDRRMRGDSRKSLETLWIREPLWFVHVFLEASGHPRGRTAPARSLTPRACDSGRRAAVLRQFCLVRPGAVGCEPAGGAALFDYRKRGRRRRSLELRGYRQPFAIGMHMQPRARRRGPLERGGVHWSRSRRWAV
jgi:hypothetical protein